MEIEFSSLRKRYLFLEFATILDTSGFMVMIAVAT